jgi:general secretion pathway protein A
MSVPILETGSAPDSSESTTATPVPPANPEPKGAAAAPDPDLDALLKNYDEQSGFRMILGLWDVDYEPANGTACDQAQRHGLSCAFQRGTWSTLKQLDRPVMMTLTGKDGNNHQVALVGLNGDLAELSLNDVPTMMSTTILSDYWFGQFILIWRPATGSDEPIGPGMRHENVRWLRQSLAALNDTYQPADMDSAFFDDELEAQLVAFQRQHRLEADGLAGQKTQVIINSLLARDGSPRLSTSR